MGLLNAGLQGIKEIAVPALVGQHVNQQKADILSKRDAMLQKVRQGETAAAQEFRTQERKEGEAATTARDTTKAARDAAESKLDREGRMDVAQERGKATARNLGYVVNKNGTVLNKNTGKSEEIPITQREQRARADQYAESDIENMSSSAKRKNTTGMKARSDEYMRQFKETIKLNKEKAGAGDGTDTSVVVFTHPTHGEVTEDDIKETMTQTKKTRQEVLDLLGYKG